MAVNGACPNCGGQFVELERAGVRIDACRNCRGVWLDRGELETLVQREQQVVAGAAHADEDFIREITGRRPHSSSHGGHSPRHHDDDDEHYDARRAQSYGLDVNTAKRIFEGYSSHKSKSKHKRKSLLDELLG